MSWEPGVVKFGDGIYEYPRETFDPKEYYRIHDNYLLKHTEITTLATLFVSRMVSKSTKKANVLKEAGLFFTRPAAVLQKEVVRELKRKGKLGFKLNIMKKDLTPFVQREKKHDPGVCPCPTAAGTPSVSSVYSDFVTESTSATTISAEEVIEVTPTLEEAMEQFILKALNTGLNTLYAARERLIIYDEAYLCLVNSIQVAVEAKWNPVIADIMGYIDAIIDNVKAIADQKRRMKKIMTNKLPIKTNRLRNNYNGFRSVEHPPPTREQIRKTLIERQGTYNRYPKDLFGVYASSWDESFDKSATAAAPIIPDDQPDDSSSSTLNSNDS